MGLAGTILLGKHQEVEEYHWRVGPLDRTGVPQAWEDHPAHLCVVPSW